MVLWISLIGLGAFFGVDGSGVNCGSPWAENPSEGAGSLPECALGSYTSGLLAGWQLPVVFGAEEAADCVPDEPDV